MKYWVPIIDLLGNRSAIEVDEEMTYDDFVRLTNEMNPAILRQVIRRYVKIGNIRRLHPRWTK